MYIDKELTKSFESKFDFEVVRHYNRFIGQKLEFTPNVEYDVRNKNSVVYSPMSIGISWPEQQKSECDKWLEENKRKFPNGWVAQEGYKTTRVEYYPSFHRDWNELMEAIRRANFPAKSINIHNIYETWRSLIVELGADSKLSYKR